MEPDDTDLTVEEFDALFERGTPVVLTNERPRFVLSDVRTSGGALVVSLNRPLARARLAPVRFSVERPATDVNG